MSMSAVFDETEARDPTDLGLGEFGNITDADARPLSESLFLVHSAGPPSKFVIRLS